MESVGIRTERTRSGPGRWNNRPRVDRAVADKTHTHCPRLEGLVACFPRTEVTLELLERLKRLELFFYGPGRFIPSFSIRDRKVLGLMPSRSAAPFLPCTTQRVSFKARRM